MKTAHICFHAARSRGLSLIEILVGLAIGLIGMLIMFQVFTASGERVRTTTSGSDAQIAGSLAMFQLDRDLRLAGLGIGQFPAGGQPGGVGGCSVAAHNGNGALATPNFNFVLAPVQIIPNATVGGPVQIAVTYGNSAYFMAKRHFNASTTTSKTLDSRDGFNVGDILLVTDLGTSAAGNCALVQITGNTNPDGVTLDHDAANPPATPFPFYAASAYPSGTIPSGSTSPFTLNAAAGPATLVATFGNVYNLGPRPHHDLWRVTAAGAANASMLVWNDTLYSDTPYPVTEGIVNLQAEYGVDDGNGGAPAVAGDGIISPTEWTTTAPADWTKLLAVRFAILARSQQYEKTAVTTVAPFWANDQLNHSFTLFNVDGTADSRPGNANDWRFYRYSVYESTVPLRNVIWGKL